MTNTERALLGLPLLCKVTVCCIKGEIPNGCGDWEGKTVLLLGRITRPVESGFQYKYKVRPEDDVNSFGVMEIEILP
jgi:hypothetical protein